MKPLSSLSNLAPLKDLARRGWMPGIMDFGRLVPSYFRVAFLGAGLRGGILQQLDRRPATVAELVGELGMDPELSDGLASWLDLGVTLGELRCEDGRYALRSRRARSLVRPGNDPLAAMYEKMAELDHRLVAETPQRLREGRRFELGDADAEIVARSSRLGEPWLAEAVRRLVPAQGPVRLLEVGCGSGAHIRTACRHNPALTALGLELQEPAAELARRNLADWGLGDRAQVETGDVRDRTPDGSFDVVTLHQNVYYFPEREQAEVLRHLAGFLAPGGRLVATTVVRGTGIATCGLDLWGAMTRGAARLPLVDELTARLQQAGLEQVQAIPLGADGMYHAFTGVRPA
ncbi:class I SAM-dependent methyltransferase [Luteococcus peritonei]|uniref:SAM-dependent methyltransferase n=1 Tax=Luteococcus peritonei TaxID=88874 RepID=A0ABW4RTG9_9ACTN